MCPEVKEWGVGRELAPGAQLDLLKGVRLLHTSRCTWAGGGPAAAVLVDLSCGPRVESTALGKTGDRGRFERRTVAA